MDFFCFLVVSLKSLTTIAGLFPWWGLHANLSLMSLALRTTFSSESWSHMSGLLQSPPYMCHNLCPHFQIWQLSLLREEGTWGWTGISFLLWFCWLSFDTGFHCVVRLALNPWWSSCLSFPHAEIKAWALCLTLLCFWNLHEGRKNSWDLQPWSVCWDWAKFQSGRWAFRAGLGPWSKVTFSNTIVPTIRSSKIQNSETAKLQK